MEPELIKKILKEVRSGKIRIEEALEKLRFFPYSDLGFAKIDHQRSLRKGLAEVVYSPGKTPSQIVKIVERLSFYNHNILITKTNKKVYQAIKKREKKVIYYEKAKMIVVKKKELFFNPNKVILVITGGTADLPVAEEAVVTAKIMGNKVECLYDVGVAGVHRLLDNLEALLKANVLVVIAGMEGALASVIGGIVNKPVIAVPTSIGYGASFQGLSALLGMLNSCAAGVAVVNIDNGFGAGYLASIINQMGEEKSIVHSP